MSDHVIEFVSDNSAAVVVDFADFAKPQAAERLVVPN